MPITDDYFKEAQEEWDLSTLYADLASAKGKRLTPMEKLHLRGLLCGHSPTEMAEILGKTVKGVETDLCGSVYRYVKALLEKGNTKISNWRNICEWLESAGYKCECATNNEENFSDKNLLNVTNIRFENNEIKIDVFLQFSIPAPLDLSIDGLNDLIH